MDTPDVTAPECEGSEAVKVGVVLTTNPERRDAVIISDDGCEIEYKFAKNEETKSFTFDQVVTSDHIEKLHSELLQHLVGLISSGHNGALLICGASTETVKRQIEHSIIRQVLTNLFPSLKSESFLSVSFIQFHPDGNALDLLSLNKQALKFKAHPVLGSLVEGVCEVCVCSAEEAFALYETCRETMKNDATSISSRF